MATTQGAQEEKRTIPYGEAIREATDQSMARDSSVYIIGEGVPDPKCIFGTTKGLLQKYGPERVRDMPVAENGMTGICIGAALSGLRPIMVHQRIDFALLALDQIINNAAKWHYMFGGKARVPIVIRMIIGMGWGQGAQHSQSLQAIFAHIPGLKVVMPATAYDAKGLMAAAVEDNNPVIYIEHRWLHGISGIVPEEYYTVPIGKSQVFREGEDITLATTSYMTIEAAKAAQILSKAGIEAEIVDVRTLKPFDDGPVISSVKKTGKLLAIDTGYFTGGFAGEIIARAAEKAYGSLESAPQRITLPDIPTPTTMALTKHYYPTYRTIISKVCEMLDKPEGFAEKLLASEKTDTMPCDVPDKGFTGPF